MNAPSKIFLLGFLPMVLASCSANAPRTIRSNPEIFRVGELEIRLYSDRDQLVRSLPPIFALLAATRVGDSQIQVSGYYDKENKRIYAVNDARTVIHEFKHYLEPEWRHGTESAHMDKVHTPAVPKSLPIPATPSLTQTAGREATVEGKSEF